MKAAFAWRGSWQMRDTCIATGEMGIGNTTTTAALVSVLLGCDPAEVTGVGAGLSSDGFVRKVETIRRGIAVNRPNPDDALDVLSKVGGLDLAGDCPVHFWEAHLPVSRW